MISTLTANERRVLGVLIEKSLSQPESYPMTLNSVLAGCNQKSNRDPLMEMNDDAVWHTLDDLREAGLVARVLPAPGARSDRFKHDALAHFAWGKRQQAIMTELLLRGPQTVSELRTRCSRMTPFEDMDAVTTCLDSLATGERPFVSAMARQSGRREIRFTHLLYPPGEIPTVSDTAPRASIEAAHHEPSGPGRSGSGELQQLRQEVGDLRKEVSRLAAELAELRALVAG